MHVRDLAHLAIRGVFNITLTIVFDFIPKLFKYCCFRHMQKKNISKYAAFPVRLSVLQVTLALTCICRYKPGTFEEIGGKYYRQSVVGVDLETQKTLEHKYGSPKKKNYVVAPGEAEATEM